MADPVFKSHFIMFSNPVYVFGNGDPGLTPPPSGYGFHRLMELHRMDVDDRAVEFQGEEVMEVEAYRSKQVFEPRWTAQDVALNVPPSHPCKLETVYGQWAAQLTHDMAIRKAAVIHLKSLQEGRLPAAEAHDERAHKRRHVEVTTASLGTQTITPPIPRWMRDTAISEGNAALGK